MESHGHTSGVEDGSDEVATVALEERDSSWGRENRCGERLRGQSLRREEGTGEGFYSGENLSAGAIWRRGLAEGSGFRTKGHLHTTR